MHNIRKRVIMTSIAAASLVAFAAPANAATERAADAREDVTMVEFDANGHGTLNRDFELTLGKYFTVHAAADARVVAPEPGDIGGYKCYTDIGETLAVPGNQYHTLRCGFARNDNEFRSYSFDVVLDQKVMPGAIRGEGVTSIVNEFDTEIIAQSWGYHWNLTALTAKATSVDNEKHSALLEGKAIAGAVVSTTTPTGVVETTVGPDETWKLEATGLSEGANTLEVVAKFGDRVVGSDNITVIINALETPIVDPIMAGGAGMLALALAGAGIAVRRKQAAQQ